MASLIVLAKSYKEVAQRIKKIAADHVIPMVENISLARAFGKEVAMGEPVPPEWFQGVAEVLSYVYKLRRR
jgi:flagellar biosynthesis protein FlhB